MADYLNEEETAGGTNPPQRRAVVRKARWWLVILLALLAAWAVLCWRFGLIALASGCFVIAVCLWGVFLSSGEGQ